jgi:hypothetical protein
VDNSVDMARDHRRGCSHPGLGVRIRPQRSGAQSVRRADDDGIGPIEARVSPPVRLFRRRCANRRRPSVAIAIPAIQSTTTIHLNSSDAFLYIFYAIQSGRYCLLRCEKSYEVYHAYCWMMMEIPMDWLFTDENIAASIVVAGFCLFSIAMCLVAR